MLSRFSCVQLICDPVDCSCQAPQSMGFPRQEYWSGLPCPPPGDLPDPGMEPLAPAFRADSLPWSHWEAPPHLQPQAACILSVCIYPFWTFHKWNHSILWMASLACFQGSSVAWHVVMATKITGHGLNINCRSMTHLYHEKKECDRRKWNLKLIPLSSWSLRHCFGWKQQVLEQKAYPII